MKAILEFDLSDSEDRAAHLRAIKATSAYLVIWDMFQELRKVWKYGDDDKLAEIAEGWKEKLAELCDAHGINIDTELE